MYLLYLGQNHVQLSKVFWKTKSVLLLDRKMKVNWKFQFFLISVKTPPKTLYSISHESANAKKGK